MKKLTALLTVLALLACLLAGCAGEAEPSETVAASANAGETGAVSTNKEPIKVGVLAPLTGTMAEFGKTYEVAMTMAAEDINEAGGINGRELVLQFEDSKGDQNQSAELASKFPMTMRSLQSLAISLLAAQWQQLPSAMKKALSSFLPQLLTQTSLL